jgi:hypothetical protein
MTDWLASGAFVDVVIALTLAEAAALLAWRRATGRGVAASDFFVNLLSGLCLMLALRAALAGSAPAWIAAWVALSGLLHGLDLWRRWTL